MRRQWCQCFVAGRVLKSVIGSVRPHSGSVSFAGPTLLLVDEPTEGLAPLMAKEVRDVLAEINRAGVSVPLVEHNIRVALSLADRVYLMGKAYIGFPGTVQALKDNPSARERYLEV